MHARQARADNAHQRRLDALRQRCVKRAQQKRQEKLLTRRLGQTAEGAQTEDAMRWREIVQAELKSVVRVEQGTESTRWSEADEAFLQQQLGPNGYLELMMATEQALLHELQADVASRLGQSLPP